MALQPVAGMPKTTLLRFQSVSVNNPKPKLPPWNGDSSGLQSRLSSRCKKKEREKTRHRRRCGNNDIIARRAKFGKFYCAWMSRVVQRSSEWIETKEIVTPPLLSATVANLDCMLSKASVQPQTYQIWYLALRVKVIKVNRGSIKILPMVAIRSGVPSFRMTLAAAIGLSI